MAIIPNIPIPVTSPLYGDVAVPYDSASSDPTSALEWINANQTLQWEREQQAAASAQAFAQASADKAMAFEAQQAETARAWSEMMSNTAHQREVQDLINAGLNPILSANAGAPAGQSSMAGGSAASASKAIAPTARDFAAQFKDITSGINSVVKSFTSAFRLLH
nr:MAG: DNA pilot protein [Microvirus sp.]